MQKARSQGPRTRRFKVSPLLPLASMGFQVLFHPPSGVLFTFPSRYSFAIGHRQVFSLGRRSSQIRPGFLVSRPTQERRHDRPTTFRLQGYHPLWLSFPTHSARSSIGRRDPKLPSTPPYNPMKATASAFSASTVWARPLSLAATRGIALAFSSSGY